MRTAVGWAVIGIVGMWAITTPWNEQICFGGVPPTPPAIADGPPTAEVAALIAALGDSDYKAREKAGKALEAMGEKVLPHLRRAMVGSDNAEVVRRLAVLIRRMDFVRLVSPKRVTLSLKDKPAKVIFDEISRQTGYKIEFQAGDGGTAKFSFEFDNIPFWVAVDKVMEAAGLGFYQDPEDHIFRINSNAEGTNPYIAYAGPFRLVANGINSNKNVQLSGVSRRGFNPRPQESINLNFQVFSEPKNPILGALPAEIISAIDDTGASLIPQKEANVYYGRSFYHNSGFQGHQANGSLNLTRGAKDATLIKSVKGKMGIIMLTGTTPEIVIDDPLKVKDKKLVGRTVELDYGTMTEANGQYTVTLTARKAGPQDPNFFDYNWSNNIWQKMELVDDKGIRFRGSPTMINNNGMSIQLTLMFGMDRRRGVAQKIGKPVKFIVNEWLQVTHEVTFEFKDVPLP